MIMINLQMFAKSASQAKAYRMAKARSKYENPGDKNKQELQEERREQEQQRRTVTTSNNITSSKQISSREVYVVYSVDENGNEKVEKERLGSELRDRIAHGVLNYSRDQKAWVTKRGKYIIRKRGRNR